MKAMSVDGIRFGYEKNAPILDNLEFTIEEGSVNAILGSNGCGKTTLLDCLIGFNKPQEGMVSVFGKDITKMSPREFAELVSYVPQNTEINMDYRVSEFILFGRTCHLGFGESPGGEDNDMMRKSAERFNIVHLLDKDINKVSGGERQLCYLARAICQESKIIIMDEPTSALDFGNQAKFLRLIFRLKEEGKTVIFTTHNPNHVMDLKCNVMMMKEGRIMVEGQSKDVMTEKNISALYGEGIKFSSDGTHFVFDIY